MTTMLAVFTCRKGNGALIRHWPYFLNQKADQNFIVITTDTQCDCPAEVPTISIGHDEYINGDHLPRRMVDTMKELLQREWDVLILAEYDTVFFKRIKVEKMTGDVAGHLAGYETWGSKAKRFYHNPWVFKRYSAQQFVEEGRKSIEEGVCGHMTHDAYGLPESSPDVFFGYVCEQLDLIVQAHLWSEYSRNSFDHIEHLHEAQQAFQDGTDIIHGIKTQRELDYICG